jgi:hypothetical protein
MLGTVWVVSVWARFWGWYERHYLLNVSIAACLFLLQILHLTWLGADVIALRLVDRSFWDPSDACSGRSGSSTTPRSRCW